MGIVLAFLAGYTVGARAGQQGYDELLASLRSVRDSEEFQGFVMALRSHASATLQDLSVRVGEDDGVRFGAQELFDRVREWAAPNPTAGAS